MTKASEKIVSTFMRVTVTFDVPVTSADHYKSLRHEALTNYNYEKAIKAVENTMMFGAAKTRVKLVTRSEDVTYEE